MDNKDALYSEEEKDTWETILRVMNDHFKSQLDENVFEGVRDEKVYHGLKLTSSTVLHQTYMDICFCEETQEYLILDKSVQVIRYSMQGKLLQPSFPLKEDIFTRMIWCDESKCFACYDPDAEYIRFLTSSCVTIKVIINEFKIKSLFYEPKEKVIIVVGTDLMVKYVLNFEEEELEPSKALRYNDPEFGADWKLESSSLVSEDSVEPRLVASYLTTLYLLPLEMVEEVDLDGSVEFLRKRINASKAPITVVYFHEWSSWTIVGDQEGNVSAWSLSFECMMLCSGAHSGQVSGISSHPMICGFLSYSQGTAIEVSKLQVWSCNFRDRMEAFEGFGPIRNISVNRLTASIVVLGSKLAFFTMHQMYCFYAPLTSAAKTLYSTNNPMYSTKIIAACGDNSVRIFASNGKQINLQILPQETLQVTSSVYSGMKNTLLTIILKTGEILASDTSVYPVKFRHVYVNDGPRITCMTVYEYFDEIRCKDGRPRKPRLFYPIRILIIMGTEEGDLIVMNYDTGKYESTYPAHRGSVIQLQSSLISHQVFSLGIDRCVKVWRVLADLPQALVIYYTLYFIIPITQISFMRDVLCMVNSSKNSKVHQVLMENMSQRVRLKHQSSQDHTAFIINIIASEILEICASSSLDKTIRIWDRENCLVKILEINTQAWNMTFSSLRGDIVFSAGRHLYKIPNENYLTPKYRIKIVANEIIQEEDEVSVPENSQYNISDVSDNEKLMLYPVSSMPLGSNDITNTDNLRVDVLILNQICALLNYRDEDITLIKDNHLKPRKLVSNRAFMITKVWEKYVKDFLNSLTRPTLETPKYDFQNIFKTISCTKKMYNEPGVFQMLFGYSIDEVDDTETLTELIKNSRLPLHGFLPNSILYKPYKKILKPKIIVKDKVKKVFPKYKYPAKFYPKEPEPEKRQSIRLSDILKAQNTDDSKEST